MRPPFSTMRTYSDRGKRYLHFPFPKSTPSIAKSPPSPEINNGFSLVSFAYCSAHRVDIVWIRQLFDFAEIVTFPAGLAPRIESEFSFSPSFLKYTENLAEFSFQVYLHWNRDRRGNYRLPVPDLFSVGDPIPFWPKPQR